MAVQRPTLVQHRWDSFIRAMGATLEALIAAFCRRDQSLSHWKEARFLECAMGIEPRHDFRYVAESIGYSCQLPSKTVHNRVTDAKNPCQISSNSCRCDETQNATGRPCPKVGKRLFRFAEPRISRCGFPQPRRRIVSDRTARKLPRPVITRQARLSVLTRRGSL